MSKEMKSLIEKRTKAKEALEALLGKAKTENRAFTADEITQFDKLEADIKAYDATIAAEERAGKITEFHVPMSSPQDLTKEQIEERAFEAFIWNKVVENRAGEQNLTVGNNGAVIPTTISSRIIDAITDICPIFQECDRYVLDGKLTIPKWTKANTTHDITVAWASEFVEPTPDSGKFTNVDLDGYLANCLVLISKKLEKATKAFNIVNFVINKIAEQTAIFIEKMLLTNDGTTKNEGALMTGNKVKASSATSFTMDDLISVQGKVKKAYQKKAKWTMNQETFNSIRKLKDNTGRYLLQDDQSLEFPYRLLGKPVEISDSMPDIKANAKPILYGDYSGLTAKVGEEMEITILREKYATMHAIGVMMWLEIDSKVTNEQKLAVLEMAAS